jgi:hypothetical protein
MLRVASSDEWAAHMIRVSYRIAVLRVAAEVQTLRLTPDINPKPETRNSCYVVIRASTTTTWSSKAMIGFRSIS